MATILLTLVVVAVAFGLIGIRVLFVKGGEFKGTCSTNNPFLKEHGIDCSVCSGKSDGECQREEVHV